MPTTILCILTLALGFSLAMAFSTENNKAASRMREMLTQCESTLPRTEHCKIIAIKDDGEKR